MTERKQINRMLFVAATNVARRALAEYENNRKEVEEVDEDSDELTEE